MRLFRREAPDPVPLSRPGPDGAGWPPPARRSFGSSTLHELGVRAAFEVEAHAVGDALLDRVVPLLDLRADPADLPHLRKLLLSAARTGAGIAIAERGEEPAPEGTVTPLTAAALWEARRRMPALPPDREPLAAFALLAGFWVARRGPEAVGELAAALAP